MTPEQKAARKFRAFVQKLGKVHPPALDMVDRTKLEEMCKAPPRSPHMPLETPETYGAVLLSRFMPRLSKADALILNLCPREYPRGWPDDASRRRARRLVREGLLEEAPTAHVFRCTPVGTDVVRAWWHAGWLSK